MNNNTLLTFVSVPNTLNIKQLTVSDLTQRAIECEKLLSANVQKANNIRQYILLAQRMEEIAIQALANKKNPSYTMSHKYIEILLEVTNTRTKDAQSVLRLLSPFCPPNQALRCAGILSGLAQNVNADLKPDFDKVAEIFSFAAKKKHTIVVVQNHLAISETRASTGESMHKLEEEFKKIPVQDWLPDNSDKGSYEVFREHVWNQIRAAKRGQNNGINPALAKNNILTEVLQSVVYRTEDQKGYPNPVTVRILYADGSEALPFTVLCLRNMRGSNIRDGKGVVTLHVGMISSRHPEMDSQVHMYWFPNILVSQTRTSAETDSLAYEHTLRQLYDLKKTGKKYLIYFYQTGFQQPLVGFYRAISKELANQENNSAWLKVQPMFFSGDKGYIFGRPWC